ncbi:MAG: InlB B-repeat-containing protein [Christensenellales bacterium]
MQAARYSRRTRPVATREGYVFKGWYDNAQLSGEAVSEIAAGIANEGDKTFYAKWEEIPAAAPEKKGCGKQTARDLAIMLGSLSAILAAALFVGKKG